MTRIWRFGGESIALCRDFGTFHSSMDEEGDKEVTGDRSSEPAAAAEVMISRQSNRCRRHIKPLLPSLRLYTISTTDTPQAPARSPASAPRRRR